MIQNFREALRKLEGFEDIGVLQFHGGLRILHCMPERALWNDLVS